MLHLLGRPSLDIDGQPALLPTATALTIALLALRYGNVAERGLVASHLWEDATAPAASNALRQVVSRTRQLEKKAGLTIVRALPQYLLRDDDCARTDLEELLGLTEIGSAQELNQLLGLYRGDLLDGVDVGGDLKQWVAEQRAIVRERFLTLATAAMRRFGGDIDAISARRISDEVGEIIQAPAPRRPVVTLSVGTTVLDEAGVPLLALQVPKAIGVPAADRLADAIVTETTIALQRLHTVQVIAPHSMRMVARDRTGKLQAALKAAYEVHSQVLPDSMSGGPAVDLSLIEVQSGILISAHMAGLHGGDLSLAAPRAAAAVAAQFADAVALRELSRGASPAGTTPYLLYLGAQRSLRTLDLRRVRHAKAQLREAIELAPQYAAAWSLLAYGVSQEWTLLGRLETEGLVEAERLAKVALDLDPGDGRAYRELGRTSRFLRDLDESLAHYAKAESLTPNDADLVADYADTRVHASDLAGARRLLDHALALNPIAPDEYLWTDGALRFFQGDYAGALKSLRRMRDAEPAARLMAAAAAMAGEAELAQQFRELELANRPGFSVDAWMRLMPQRTPAHAELYAEALRLAGFPS